MTSLNEQTLNKPRLHAMIRFQHAAYGHTDVAVERRWIDTDTPGHPFLLKMPAAADDFVPLVPSDHLRCPHATEELARHAAFSTSALVNLQSGAAADFRIEGAASTGRAEQHRPLREGARMTRGVATPPGATSHFVSARPTAAPAGAEKTRASRRGPPT